MVVAGDADLAGDNQGHHRVRNSVAHTMSLLSTATTALNAGEPERTTKEITRPNFETQNDAPRDIQACAK